MNVIAKLYRGSLFDGIVRTGQTVRMLTGCGHYFSAGDCAIYLGPDIEGNHWADFNGLQRCIGVPGTDWEVGA